METAFKVARHVITLASGVLVGIGVVNSEQAASLLSNYEAIVGAVGAIATIGFVIVKNVKGLFGKSE